MADKLTVYNLALGHLGERRLASLTEAREPRRVLDSYWDQVVAEGLAEALWNFMLRAIQIDASSTVAPAFGWSYAFKLPNDWVRTIMVSSDQTFTVPLMDYVEEAGYWYANVTPLYARGVSSDPLYGMNLGSWPPNFTAWIGFLLAEYSCFRITGSKSLLEGADGIIKRGYKAKIKAKSNDAMNEPPGHAPTGTWTRARRGFSSGARGDRYDD